MKDQYLIGFIAGMIGGVVSSLINYPFYLLKIAKLRLIDYAVQLILGRLPQNFTEIIFGEVIHWGFCGAVGVLFAYLVNHNLLTNKHLWFKGWGFGLGFWFFINVLTTIYHVQNLAVVSLQTAAINALASSGFGIIMAIVVNWLNNKGKIWS